jgi:uncharacterized membrane protein (UPF0127 family)
LPSVNRELGIFADVRIRHSVFALAWRWLGVGLGLGLGLAGCGGNRPPAPAALPKSIADYFPIAVGGELVEMQVAVTPPELERGLMERRDLGPNQGMIFVYPVPQRQSFWMRNCPTPLDVGYFFAAGDLAEVYPMYPYDERPVTSRSDNIKFILEMNQGWYNARGVRPGARLDFRALGAAVRARGFDPKKFGLDSP